MCHSYTFCRQSKRKLYSVSYKMVISCFANIPISPPLWCYSVHSRKAKQKWTKSSVASLHPAAAAFTCESQPETFPLLLRDYQSGTPGERAEKLQLTRGPQNLFQPQDKFLWAPAKFQITPFPKGIGAAHLGSALPPSEQLNMSGFWIFFFFKDSLFLN